MQTSLPLSGVRVFDLTRILAGPTCTQLLGDLGADIIKVEKPFVGDDTRTWGPPYVKDRLGNDTTESAYYLSANRNKRSVTIDLSEPAGIELAKKFIEKYGSRDEIDKLLGFDTKSIKNLILKHKNN